MAKIRKQTKKTSNKTEEVKATSEAKAVKAVEESSHPQPQKSLYDKEIERYRLFLQRGFDTAYKYYGFTLFHSLSPEEKVELFQKLGFDPQNSEDYYNLGCLAVTKEDYAVARNSFEKTIELAADFEEAYYNLALTQEKLGNDKAAIENWEIYNEFLEEDSSEALLISQHIDDLKATKTETETKSSSKK